jgi:hypothetical protein
VEQNAAQRRVEIDLFCALALAHVAQQFDQGSSSRKDHPQRFDRGALAKSEPFPNSIVTPARGRAAKRAWKHFWQEGARLENRADLDDPYEAPARKIRQDRQIEMDF